jgi:hypothetical protein
MDRPRQPAFPNDFRIAAKLGIKILANKSPEYFSIKYWQV